MLATKKLFPYQSFQGDHVLESSDNEDDSSEDEDDVANSMFCMAADMDPAVVQEQRKTEALRDISKKLSQLDPQLLDALPVHYRWIVKAFADVAVEHALVFETATNHELILEEFKDAAGTAADENGVQKLGKFWKAGTYGEITCPAMDIVSECAVQSPGPTGATVSDIVWYDLGSGVGKAVLQFALQHPIKRAAGIELAKSRHDIAAAAHAWLKERNAPYLSKEEPAVICGSFTDRIYQDATHVFANSLLFGPELEQAVANILAGCPVLHQVVATTKLPLPQHMFQLRKERLQLPVSWQEQPQQAYVFERRKFTLPSVASIQDSASSVGKIVLDEASVKVARAVLLAQEK